MSLLEVKNLSYTIGDKLLYKDASLELFHGEHMGLVGQNGTGKSTLIKILIGEAIPDAGEIKWHPKIKIAHLDQYANVDGEFTIQAYLETAFSELFETDERLQAVNRELETNPTDELVMRSIQMQEYLDFHEFHKVDSEIQKVAQGLGIAALGMDRQLSTLSGGQRAKVILAKLLLEQPNLLLMDEPTNFLDKEHVDWLAKYLKDFKGAFIVVSHDFAFLDRISTCICDLEFETLKKYGGDYTTFLKQKGLKREEYLRQYESQKKLIAKTEEYIAKNKVRASTAAMAKSRQKMLDKIDRMPPPSVAAKPNFSFDALPLVTQNLLKVKELEIGYYYPLLPKLSFRIASGKKAVITGFNGIGKTTLLKTLIGEIPALSGSFQFADGLKIGYFQQDLAWDNEDMTPLAALQEEFTQMNQKQLRKALARCGVKAEHAVQKIGTLSGGEQAKVKLCFLTLKPHHVLVLDEPTNHLDAEAKEVLLDALKKFEGSLILVSHEPAFYEKLADQQIDIEALFD